MIPFIGREMASAPPTVDNSYMRTERSPSFKGIHLAILLLAALGTISGATVDSFEKPIRKRVVDFGLNPYYTRDTAPHIKLTCYFYPRFMVKEYDKGDLGSEWLAIVPIRDGDVPACKRSHDAQEKVIRREWTGYFKGAKGRYVFFDAEDSFNGGRPFAVYDADTQSKVFDDSAADSLTFDRTPDGLLTMRYQRVVLMDCSIVEQKDTCWDKFRLKSKLADVPIPQCSGYSGDAEDSDPSVVEYKVEVLLSSRLSVRPLLGQIRCWAAD
jgi:hypothetical protein